MALFPCGPRARKSSPPKSPRSDLPDNLKDLAFKELKYLAHKHPSLIHSEQLDKKTRVWLAAEIGSVKDVERAYAAGDVTLADKSPEGHKLIHACAGAGSSPLVRLFLDQGEQINVLNDTGETPLFMAANSGHHQLVKALMSLGADVNKPNIYGETPLYMACYHGHVDVIRVLVRSKALAISEANEEGIQPVDVARRYAVTSPQHKTIIILLEQSAAWSKVRLVLLGNRKNKENPNCPLRQLSPFAVKLICSYIARIPQQNRSKSPSPPRVVEEDFM